MIPMSRMCNTHKNPQTSADSIQALSELCMIFALQFINVFLPNAIFYFKLKFGSLVKQKTHTMASSVILY